MPSTERNRAEVVAGVLSIQSGDLVFFYVKNQGIYGLWKVAGELYFDETKVWANDQQMFPYRFSFEPVVDYFPKPVSLSDVLDLGDKGRIWTFDLNPVQQKKPVQDYDGRGSGIATLALEEQSYAAGSALDS